MYWQDDWVVGAARPSRGHPPANIASLIRVPLRGAKGEGRSLVFDRVAGRGFVMLWLSRLGLSTDRARSYSALDIGIEIAGHPSCSDSPGWSVVRCGGGLHGSSGCWGYRFQRLYVGSRADG